MGKIVSKIAVILLTISLIACSTNTRKENTAIGAVSGATIGGLAGSLVGGGAAIGIGAIAGGLIGGTIGHSMDSSDNTIIYHTLENNHTNRATHWKNASTGARYTVIPTSNRVSINGNDHCRHFRATGYVDGKKEKFTGIACKQADGTWQTINH